MRATIHELNGRLRIKLNKVNGEAFKKDEIFTLLKYKAIENISINSKNSCFTVHYNPELLDSQQIKKILGLNTAEVIKERVNSSKATGAYSKKVQNKPQFEYQKSAQTKLSPTKSSSPKNKDLVVYLAKSFGSTLFKTTLKETLSIALNSSVGLNISSNIGKNLLQVK